MKLSTLQRTRLSPDSHALRHCFTSSGSTFRLCPPPLSNHALYRESKDCAIVSFVWRKPPPVALAPQHDALDRGNRVRELHERVVDRALAEGLAVAGAEFVAEAQDLVLAERVGIVVRSDDAASRLSLSV